MVSSGDQCSGRPAHALLPMFLKTAKPPVTTRLAHPKLQASVKHPLTPSNQPTALSSTPSSHLLFFFHSTSSTIKINHLCDCFMCLPPVTIKETMACVPDRSSKAQNATSSESPLGCSPLSLQRLSRWSDRGRRTQRAFCLPSSFGRGRTV